MRLPVLTVFCAAMMFLAAVDVFAADPVLPQSKPFTDAYVGDVHIHKAAYEDTMVKLARENGLGFVELRAANPGIDPWMPGEGTELLLPTMHLLPDGPRDGIVINLPEMRLYAFIEKDKPPYSYAIGVGREGLATPTGSTTVVRKKIGPTWRPTERMRKEDPELPEFIGPGSDNPLGTHALYLGWPQYAIHGTNKPFGIGRRVSSGCIRLYPEDIVRLFDLIPVGTKVSIVDRPIKVSWIGDELYMEAHPSLAQADQMEQEGSLPFYEFTAKDISMIVDAAGEYADRLDWVAIRRIVRERYGYPMLIATKPNVDRMSELGPAAGDAEEAVKIEPPAPNAKELEKQELKAAEEEPS